MPCGRSPRRLFLTHVFLIAPVEAVPGVLAQVPRVPRYPHLVDDDVHRVGVALPNCELLSALERAEPLQGVSTEPGRGSARSPASALASFSSTVTLPIIVRVRAISSVANFRSRYFQRSPTTSAGRKPMRNSSSAALRRSRSMPRIDVCTSVIAHGFTFGRAFLSARLTRGRSGHPACAAASDRLGEARDHGPGEKTPNPGNSTSGRSPPRPCAYDSISAQHAHRPSWPTPQRQEGRPQRKTTQRLCGGTGIARL